MSRVRRGPHRRNKRRRILKLTRGYRGMRGKLYRHAMQAVDRALSYGYRDRRNRKRDFRRIWITRISAASRERGLPYARFAHGLTLARIEVNRKQLAELAVHDPEAFDSVVERARAALDSHAGEPATAG